VLLFACQRQSNGESACRQSLLTILAHWSEKCLALSAYWRLFSPVESIMGSVEDNYSNNLRIQKTIMNNKTKIGLIVTLAGIASNLTAGDFTSYATGDVLICFRSGSGYDLVVDAGPITTFTGYAANSRHTITQFNSTQLSDLGFQTSTFNWSAFTYLANNTLYLTKANNNTAVYTQTTPANDGSSSQQGLAASHMSSIVAGTANFIPGGPAHSGSPYSDSTARRWLKMTAAPVVGTTLPVV